MNDIRYRDCCDPPGAGVDEHATKWTNEHESVAITRVALEAYVQRKQYLGDIVVGWAELYDRNTGDVIARYEHPSVAAHRQGESR